MKTVLDTNVWLSGIFWRGNPYKIIKLAEDGKIEIIITRSILEEILSVINRERFQKKIGKESIEDLVRTILSITTLVKTKSNIYAVKEDPDDNKILEAAMDGKAHYIVSGDKHLLDMKVFGSIKILKPKEFLESL